MDENLVIEQALRYAEELRTVHAHERAQRRRAEDALARLDESYRLTVRALAAALELRDDQTGGHAERVTALGLRLAERIAPELLADRELEYGFLLHDLGKIGIPDAILLKPGRLEPAEMDVVRRHPQLGARILDSIPYLNGLASDVVASHHERWDGCGYPNGLRRKAIPQAARIFAVVDAFDAMTNDRPYRVAMSTETALAELRNEAGRQFDPEIAREFASLVGELSSAPAAAAV